MWNLTLDVLDTPFDHAPGGVYTPEFAKEGLAALTALVTLNRGFKYRRHATHWAVTVLGRLGAVSVETAHNPALDAEVGGDCVLGLNDELGLFDAPPGGEAAWELKNVGQFSPEHCKSQ
ncbi:hypothetical protein [Pollutimonas bauzanensis]|uniref:Uncharacterized protein n=1 Tax=Pollutimonas bauzanensis TaxID=658167 RepID=A0A1M5YJ71_9BURK|nr:hypothetical protein [Pollutimonas bauzanensis]SHI12066.1 hypothetical protein SAMN04488135_109146 [Pollutimonas bauzanensis]